jgi:hypothetical protein
MVMGVGGSKKSAEEFGRTIARIKDDIASMEKSVEKMAVQMAKAADSSQRIKTRGGGGGGGGGGGSSSTGTGQGNTGVAQDQQIGVSEVRTSSIGQQMLGDMGRASGSALLGIPGNLFNDLRVGRNTASQYEQSRLIARGGTGQFDNFRGLMNTAMGDFNVQNRAVLERDVATAMKGGWGAGFGGGQAGQEKAAASMGGLHTLARASGIAPEAVQGMGNSLYSSGTYYKAMAAGIMTRDPRTGEMLSPEAIVNQYYNQRLQGKSRDEVMNAIKPGGGLRAELEQTFGDPAMVESLVTGMTIAVENGGTIAEGAIEQAAVEAGYLGSDNTKIGDSESKLQGAEQGRIMEFTGRVADGVERANGLLETVNDELTARGADSWVGTLEEIGGGLDALNTRLPDTTGAINGLISALSGAAVGGATSAFFRGRGGKGGSGGGGGSTPVGTKWNPIRAPKLGSLARGGALAVGGAVASGGVSWLQDNASGDSWDTVDTVGTVAGRAGAGALTGAGIGGMVGSVVPIFGNMLGAGIGAVIGTGVGAWQGWRESQERKNSYSEGTAFVEQDQQADIHYGEMILPNRIADAVRTELAAGRAGQPSSGSGTSVVINVTVQRATDAEAMRLVRLVKSELESDRELVSIGSGRAGGF